jgi:hypothetical protein
VFRILALFAQAEAPRYSGGRAPAADIGQGPQVTRERVTATRCTASSAVRRTPRVAHSSSGLTRTAVP